MKKVLLSVVILAAVVFGAYKLFFSGKADGEANSRPKDKPLTISKNSEAFNASFGKLLNTYFDLKAGLTDYDTVKANTAARQLAIDADELKIKELKGDTTGAIAAVAGNSAQTISGAAKNLVAAADLEKKKREFKMISESLYDLARIVKYDRLKIFHQHCPMAFNDSEEATWISNSGEVVNPYLGRKHPKYKDKMLGCGDVTDSLDFAKP
ncbi:MAG TPA: DUF3347 domain-containing protein [Chitinophagaceae bacterium]|nr:DUF3347 domain-containing protein [Chitinophagaceae bacterium]